MSEPDLEGWGRRLGRDAPTPVFIALSGPLGAGKSVLARAVAGGAGVEGPVPSPTFALVLRYPARGDRVVVHLDLYRLEGPDDLRELGWEELGAPDELVLVEWAERAGPRLPADRWEVSLRPVPGRPGLRDVRVSPVGRPPAIPLPGTGTEAGSSSSDTRNVSG